jgi:hypothetical protein
LIDGVLLHVECRRFWGKPDPWAGLDIPDFLDRTAELRSEETP